jgi:plastocyanin
MRFVSKAAAAAVFAAVLAAGPAFAAEHQVAIKGFKFLPAELTVAVGDTVVFTNEDGAPHTATADDGSFDTGRLAKGESAIVTIGAAGTFSYICALHPAMKGSITAN